MSPTPLLGPRTKKLTSPPLCAHAQTSPEGAFVNDRNFLHHLIQRRSGRALDTHFLESNPLFAADVTSLSDEELVCRKTLLNSSNSGGLTPLLAVLNPLRYFPEEDSTEATKERACRLRDVFCERLLERLLSFPDIDLSAADPQGKTVAHAVAERGGANALQRLRFLTSRDVSLLSAVDAKGRPPLLYSASKQIAAYLFEASTVRTGGPPLPDRAIMRFSGAPPAH